MGEYIITDDIDLMQIARRIVALEAVNSDYEYQEVKNPRTRFDRDERRAYKQRCRELKLLHELIGMKTGRDFVEQAWRDRDDLNKSMLDYVSS